MKCLQAIPGPVLLAVMVSVTACKERPATVGSGANPQTLPMASAEDQNPSGTKDQQIYQVKGVVKELEPERKKVRIAHEEIPGYMAAMTMMFDVKDAAELDGLAPGDEVTFRMIVTKDDGWVDQLTKVGQVSPIQTALPSNFRLVRDVDPLSEGDVMPNYDFTNEVGQAVSLKDYQGQAVAMTFLFTRCPFPTFCPRMSSNFAEVYTTLKNMSDAPDNWHLFSITIDPEYDTPSVLKNYAQAYTYDPKRWNYLTGPLIDITAITEQFGLQFYRPDPSQPAGLNHNLRTVVVDAAGKVQKIIIGNEWKPAELVEEIVRAAKAKDSIPRN